MNNYRKYFVQSIKGNFPSEFDKVIADTDYNYRNISADIKIASISPNPLDKRLDFSSYFLALIKTLEEKGETFDTIKKVCIEIVLEYVRPKNKIHQFFKRLPAKLINTWLMNIIIKLLNNKIRKNSHPDGFVAKIITDKQETYELGYGIDILECGICKLFAKHNYDKFSSILCEVDAITSDLAELQLIRMGTIANSAKKCDFRFKKISTTEKTHFNQTKKFLGIVTLFAGLMLVFPLFANIFYPKTEKQTITADQANIQTVEFAINGMTCSGYEENVNHEVNKLTGIVKTTVSHENGNAIVAFEQTQTDIKELEKAIEKQAIPLSIRKN